MSIDTDAVLADLLRAADPNPGADHEALTPAHLALRDQIMRDEPNPHHVAPLRGAAFAGQAADAVRRWSASVGAAVARLSPSVSVGVALVLVAVVVGAVAVPTLSGQVVPPAGEPSGVTTPTPIEPSIMTGVRTNLLRDKTLTAESLGEGLEWVQDKGLDVSSLKGYESVAGTQSWTAEKEDGSGRCIFLRTDDGEVLDEIGCATDSKKSMIYLDRTVDGMVLRFYSFAGGVTLVRQS